MGTKKSDDSSVNGGQIKILSRFIEKKCSQSQKVKLRWRSQSHVHQNEKSSETNRHCILFKLLRTINGIMKQWAKLRN
jgi:hypothetical protein